MDDRLWHLCHPDDWAPRALNGPAPHSCACSARIPDVRGSLGSTASALLFIIKSSPSPSLPQPAPRLLFNLQTKVQILHPV